MRNLQQYPITEAEKIAVLRQMINQEQTNAVGDITAVALQEILKDLYHATSYKEGIAEPVNFLPLTPGLLISMAIRMNHSFGYWMMAFEKYQDLTQKQISILNEVCEIYHQKMTCGDSQLIEEMTGNGFYSSDRETYYCDSVSPDVLEHAMSLVNRKDMT